MFEEYNALLENGTRELVPLNTSHNLVGCRGDHFQFGLVFIKKVTKSVFFEKTEIGSNRPVSVWFGYFRTKIGFFDLARFFPVSLGFFLVWVRFDFFGFRFIKPKPNRTDWFFKNSNRFFFTVQFFRLFFSVFSI
jgi:hypothetical protein